jgi:non-ribosomal peptide synthetase component F
MYGPTETTIWSTTCRVLSGGGPVSIGAPIANTQVYVLDAGMNPVPIGVAGELFIGVSGSATEDQSGTEAAMGEAAEGGQEVVARRDAVEPS